MATPHQIAQWNDWLQRFLQSKRASNRSEKTIESYAYHLHHFLGWMQKQAQSNADFTQPETIEAFLVSQQKAGFSPFTIAGRYRSLRVWYRFLVRRVKCMEASPVDEVESPALPNDVRPYVSLATYQRLMDSIEPLNWFDMRDRCMVYLMFWCGLRVSELLHLAPVDVDANRQQVTVRAGKGGKGRIVPCGNDLGAMVYQYLIHLPLTAEGLKIAGDPLFISNNGIGGARAALTENGLRQMLRRRCSSAGLPYLKPHSFRHGYAMLFLNNGMDLSAVSKTMGHASEQFTSRIYAHWLPEGIRREYAEVRRRVAPGQ